MSEVFIAQATPSLCHDPTFMSKPRLRTSSLTIKPTQRLAFRPEALLVWVPYPAHAHVLQPVHRHEGGWVELAHHPSEDAGLGLAKRFRPCSGAKAYNRKQTAQSSITWVSGSRRCWKLLPKESIKVFLSLVLQGAKSMPNKRTVALPWVVGSYSDGSQALAWRGSTSPLSFAIPRQCSV
eukprot:3317270-Amphidinium_carterae.1